ncbi:WWE domain-containing protein, partial [Durusdinium trenchii]
MVKFEEPNRKSTIVHGEAELKPWSLKHGYKEDDDCPNGFSNGLASTKRPGDAGGPRRYGQCMRLLEDSQIVRGKRFKLQCKVPKEHDDLHLLFLPVEKKKMFVVAVDVGLAKDQKGIEAVGLVHNRRLAKNFLCSRPARLESSHRRQEITMAVAPLQQTDTAQVALCLVKESDTLGSDMWTLLDHLLVEVQRTERSAEVKPLEELLAKAEEKLKEDFGRVLSLLKSADAKGARLAAEALLRKDGPSQPARSSILKGLSQARTFQALLEAGGSLLEKYVPDREHELQDLKRTLQNLQQSLHLTWDDAVTDGPDGPDGLAMLLERHQHDANVTLPVELPLRGEMLMANLAVHRKRGVTLAGLRVMLCWQSGAEKSDLALELCCPESGCEVGMDKAWACACVDDVVVTVETLPEGDLLSSLETLGLEVADAGLEGQRILNIKDGPLKQAATRLGLKVQVGDFVKGIEESKVRLSRPRVSRVHLDVAEPGAKHAKSLQNLFVQQPSEKRYVLQVRLCAGEPVPYQVLLQRAGWPDMVYELPPHEHVEQAVEIFSGNG